jgi:hypothetical protein
VDVVTDRLVDCDVFREVPADRLVEATVDSDVAADVMVDTPVDNAPDFTADDMEVEAEETADVEDESFCDVNVDCCVRE